ncbi:MAG: putative porin [Bacteroidales bacterium]|nr:putative porin [Bacteroidales bacterium]
MRRILLFYILQILSVVVVFGQSETQESPSRVKEMSPVVAGSSSSDTLAVSKKSKTDSLFQAKKAFADSVAAMMPKTAKRVSGTNDSLRNKGPHARAWQIDERFGRQTAVPVDTLDLNFQNERLVESKDVAVNFLGTVGSPAETKIWFNRKETSPFIFTHPYEFYLLRPGNLSYLNTKSPFTMLKYHRDLNKQDGEELVDVLFSTNVNKNLAFGAEYNLIYGRGYYEAQSTNHDQFAAFASYNTDTYKAHLYIGTRSFLNYENGGISDDRYITSPQEMSGGKREFEPKNIPVNMTDAWVRLYGNVAFLNHQYNVGFYKMDEDSLQKEFVPVTSFIHTLKYESFNRRYLNKTIPKGFYQNIYLDSLQSDDKTQYHSFKNTFAISLLEGFNKYTPFGLSVFLEHDMRAYSMMDSTLTGNKDENLFATTIGAELARRKKGVFTFDVLGEMGVAGEELGRVKLEGNLGTTFRIGRDTVLLAAYGSIKNLTPEYYQEHYHSNHFYWDRSLKKEQQVHFGGTFSLPNRGTQLKVDVENLTNHIYFNSNALVDQYTDNVQIVAAQLNQNFKLGILHLDNSVVYQKSSSQSVVPVPEISLYHNLYLQSKAFNKVLAFQIGADVRYHTRYYVPSYMPATGQFYNQNLMETGNYPMVNVYANLHLKNMRFYMMAYHINSSVGSADYFIQPHYPMNPFHFKFGLGWNFND